MPAPPSILRGKSFFVFEFEELLGNSFFMLAPPSILMKVEE